MVKVIIVLSILLLISLLSNIVLYWYIKNTLKQLLFVSENLSFFKKCISGYAKHLKSIYQLETYYGDETIKFLFEHTRQLLDKVMDFQEIISLTENEELVLDDREIEVDGGSITPEKEDATQIERPQEKFVLYGGTRGSDS